MAALDFIDTEEVFDIEDDLTNTKGHFRSCHFECSKRMIPGTILESNCGKLYRTTGKVMRIIWSECKDCIKNIGRRPCPICNTGEL